MFYRGPLQSPHFLIDISIESNTFILLLLATSHSAMFTLPLPMAFLTMVFPPICVTCWRHPLPATAILGALVPLPPSSQAFSRLTEMPTTGCRHQMCSCVAFALVTSLLSSSPSLPGQCSLSLTGEVLPKIVRISIPTEIEMKQY